MRKRAAGNRPWELWGPPAVLFTSSSTAVSKTHSPVGDRDKTNYLPRHLRGLTNAGSHKRQAVQRRASQQRHTSIAGNAWIPKLNFA